MKPNKLTSGANVMRVKNIKPEITEEELQEMFGRLNASKSNTLEVTIAVYGEYENRQLRGIVTGLDPRQRLIKIEHNYDWDLIEFENVIGVHLDDFYFKEEY